MFSVGLPGATSRLSGLQAESASKKEQMMKKDLFFINFFFWMKSINLRLKGEIQSQNPGTGRWNIVHFGVKARVVGPG